MDDFDWIAEETAWAIIELKKWIATPQLLFALKQYVIELETERLKDATKERLIEESH